MTLDACAPTQLMLRRAPTPGDGRIGRRRYDGGPATQASAWRVQLHVEMETLASNLRVMSRRQAGR